jgi:hypothetical protein
VASRAPSAQAETEEPAGISPVPEKAATGCGHSLAAWSLIDCPVAG